MALRDFGGFGGLLLNGGVIDRVSVPVPSWVGEAGTTVLPIDPAPNSAGANGYGLQLVDRPR